MKTLKWALIWLACGAVLFWTPDVVLHGLAAGKFSGRHVLILTYGLPLVVLTSLLLIGRFRWTENRKLIAPFVLLGIWLAGGLAMTIGATFSGGGFATSGGWKGLGLGAIPPFTLMMASYDGSLFALLLTTLCLFTIWLVGAVRPKLLLHAGLITGLAVLVIFSTALCHVAVSQMTSRLREPVAAAQLQRDDALDNLALDLKSVYHGNAEVPVCLSNHPPVISLRDLQPLLARHQVTVSEKVGDFRYCNLKPEVWKVLRQHRSAEQRGFLSALTFTQTSYEELKRFGEYPVAWTSQPDASNLVGVITVSFKSDIFRPCGLSTEDLDKTLNDMQSLIRKETANESFSLPRAKQ